MEKSPHDNSKPSWNHFSHGADIGVEGRGPSQAASFEQAAPAITTVVADPTIVSPVEKFEIACDGPDPELLLVEWLMCWRSQGATSVLDNLTPPRLDARAGSGKGEKKACVCPVPTSFWAVSPFRHGW